MATFCIHCFEHAGLRARIQPLVVPSEPCSFHPEQPGISAEQLAEIIDPAFKCYHRVIEDGSEGDDLASALGEFIYGESEEIIYAVVDALGANDSFEDPYYDDSFCYIHDVNIGAADHTFMWSRFRESILHEQRFFNPGAKRVLDTLFDGVHLLQDSDGSSPVYQLPEDTFIFRARVAEGLQSITFTENPRQELGPPPVKLRRAGRMNPAGIPAFYGALELDTCVAELRPMRRRTVVGCAFRTTRPIWVIDLSFFRRTPMKSHPFSANHIKHRHQWNFLLDFEDEISRPVFPEDEAFDYIPTQAVAEYLSSYNFMSSNGKEAKIDAVIYPSAQHDGGRNIVFLGDVVQCGDDIDFDERAFRAIAQPLDFVEGSVRVFSVVVHYSTVEMKKNDFLDFDA